MSIAKNANPGTKFIRSATFAEMDKPAERSTERSTERSAEQSTEQSVFGRQIKKMDLTKQRRQMVDALVAHLQNQRSAILEFFANETIYKDGERRNFWGEPMRGSHTAESVYWIKDFKPNDAKWFTKIFTGIEYGGFQHGWWTPQYSEELWDILREVSRQTGLEVCARRTENNLRTPSSLFILRPRADSFPPFPRTTVRVGETWAVLEDHLEVLNQVIARQDETIRQMSHRLALLEAAIPINLSG